MRGYKLINTIVKITLNLDIDPTVSLFRTVSWKRFDSSQRDFHAEREAVDFESGFAKRVFVAYE
jgi:hypothetical protein